MDSLHIDGLEISVCGLLIVYFPSVADDEDKDRQDIVFNLVDDAIVSHPDAVTGPAFELFIAVGSWVSGQLF